MFLKDIKIKDKNNTVIREVNFKKGVNIIKGVEVDTGIDIDSNSSSTNSIGKTTLLRCIDFCLLGKWNQFVFDKEFKNEKNITVFDFFKKSLPTFELSITKDLDSAVSMKWVVSRSLVVNERSKRDSTYFSVENCINGNKVSEEAYSDKIKEILFELTSPVPRLRQLIPKFIRTSDHQISNIINYLNPMTSNSEYELLHLFLFDFSHTELISKKITKESELQNKLTEVKSLKDIVGIGAEEINDVKNNELKEQQYLYDSFKIDENYQHEDDLLNVKQEELNHIKANITNIRLNMEVWKRRLKDLTESKAEIDSESIHYMYKEADMYNVELQKKYDETIEFHKSMLENEISFISNSIAKSCQKLEDLEVIYRDTANQYSTLLEDLGNKGSLADFTKIGNYINELTREIAENEALINKLEKSKEDLARLKLEFETLVKEIDELISSQFRRKLAIFNGYFLEYSKDLSNNGYILATKVDKKQHVNLIPTSQNRDGHVGDGRKQTLVIAFDLAYTAFSKDPSVNIVRPSFFTQDKIEIVDKTMLDQLISLVNSVECQFIFPVINDKIDGLTDFDDDNVILCLSEDKKFFNIENYEANNLSINNTALFKYSPNSKLKINSIEKLIFTSTYYEVA